MTAVLTRKSPGSVDALRGQAPPGGDPVTHPHSNPPRPHEFGAGLWVHYVAGGPGHATLRLGEIRQAVEGLPGVTSVHAHPPALVGEHRPHEETR